MRINDDFLKLTAGYLFPEIGRRVRAFQDANPDAAVIKMGIGDVTEPLPDACIRAMHRAVDDQAGRETFHGYGPEQGYAWLREKIVAHDYAGLPDGVTVEADEVFVSDGSKCDTANILDILGPGNTVAVTDPVYPVYVDTNVMAGNTGPAADGGGYEGIVYLPLTEANEFTAALPERPVSVIYLCFPNNPTGAVASKAHLKQWVDYALAHDALILFDAAYEAYITDDALPRSIYEIEGARRCAVEFRSCSKNAGFTGTRCGYTVVPKDLMGKSADGSEHSLHALWKRRQSTKFNGASYVVQRGAEAIYSEEGRAQIKALVSFYLANAKLIREGLESVGVRCYGGVHAPYIWLKTPGDATSWGFFDQLLNDCHVVGTPGAGFGAAGEGYFRLSAFNSRANVEEAMARITARLTV